MAMTNRERVNCGLQQLRAGLIPFVERELSSRIDDYWEERLCEVAPFRLSRNADGGIHWDTRGLVKVIIDRDMWQNGNLSNLVYKFRRR